MRTPAAPGCDCRVPEAATAGITTIAFRIEEFRRPEFEVNAETSEGPHFVGKHAIATVTAAYFAGGGLANAEVNWEVRAEDAYFTPPNRQGYHFGKPHRWFWWGSDDDDEKRKAREPWKAETDAEGQHRLRIDFEGLTPAYPRQLSLEANVKDVNRQSWSARSSFVVHPASVTVGLRSQSQLLKAGSEIQLDVLVTNVDGKAIKGRDVTVRSTRIRRIYRGRRSIEKELDSQTCTVKSGTQAVRCSPADQRRRPASHRRYGQRCARATQPDADGTLRAGG